MKPKLILGWIVAATLLLAACSGTAPSSEGADAESLPDSSESKSQGKPPGEQLVMIVGPELVDCEGAHPQKCMQVKFNPDDDWQLFYDQVEGFQYEPGYRYTLLVEKLEVQDPPADGSTIQYVLVELQEQSEALVTESANLEDHFWVLTGLGTVSEPRGVLEKLQVSLEYDPVEGRISGSAGCNRYFGEVALDGNDLTISTGPMGMTRMACSEEVMEQEAAFIEALGRVTRFAIEGETLYLFSDSEEVLVFSPGTPQAQR